MKIAIILLFIFSSYVFAEDNIISVETKENEIIHSEDISDHFGTNDINEVLREHSGTLLNIELTNGEIIDVNGNMSNDATSIYSKSSGGQEGGTTRGTILK